MNSEMVLVWVEALRPSQQFFGHVGTENSEMEKCHNRVVVNIAQITNNVYE